MSDSPSQRSHAERIESAGQTYQRFVPEADPDRVAASMARRYGPLGTFAFETVGEMWDRPALSRRDRSLMIIAALAAQARDEELVLHTQVGLRHGLTRIEIEEILPHTAAYAGFPAAMAASRSIDQGLREAEGVERLSPREGSAPKGDAERDADAAVVRARMTGTDPLDPPDALQQMVDRLGPLGEVAHRWAFGEIWSRDELSPRDRSIVVITILVALNVERALRFHVHAGANHGLTRAEIEEIITHLGLYVGLPRAIAAMTVARVELRRLRYLQQTAAAASAGIGQ